MYDEIIVDADTTRRLQIEKTAVHFASLVRRVCPARAFTVAGLRVAVIAWYALADDECEGVEALAVEVKRILEEDRDES